MLTAQFQENRNDILRYGVGMTFTLFIAVTFSGFLSYLLPVMTIPLLAARKELSIAGGLIYIGVVIFAVIIADLIVILFSERPAALILVLFLAIFHIFHTRSKYIPNALKTLLLICVMMIPNISIMSDFLARGISVSLIWIAVKSVLCVWLMYFIFPVKKSQDTPSTSADIPVPNDKKRDFQQALIKALVILPLLLLFFSKNLTSSLLVLIYVAMLAMQSGFGEGFKKGLPMFIGNLAGGIMAVLMYELITIAPHLLFFVFLMLLVGLFVGRNLFSASPYAPLYGMAISTFLLVIGATTSGGDTDAETKVWTRVLQVVLAVAYVAISFGIIDKWRKESSEKQ